MEFLNVFAAVDKDEDKVINREDLELYAKTNAYDSGSFTSKWLKLFDADNDGRITFGEFCEALGFEEKETEEKLIAARKIVAERAKSGVGNERAQGVRRPANRRSLTPQTSQPIGIVQRSGQDKDNQGRRATTIGQKYEKANEDDNEVIKPKTALRVRATPNSDQNSQQTAQSESIEPKKASLARSAPGQGEQKTEITENDSISTQNIEVQDKVEVLFCDMNDADKAKLMKLLASAWLDKNTEERKAYIEMELKKNMGNGWLYQFDPAVKPQEVNYEEGKMGVFLIEGEKIMVWKSENTGGSCLCC